MWTKMTFIALMASASLVQAQGPGEFVIAGQGVTASSSCLTLTGVKSDTGSRSRWVTGYWEKTSTPPVCSDTDPHFDPVIECLEMQPNAMPESEGQTAFIKASGPGKTTYLIKVIDRRGGVDEFGVVPAVDLEEEGPCGAAGVPTSPLVSGDFLLIH
ncbi:MAG: hypothetical protein ACLGH3_10290 [Actinomycetota bacterium]